MKQFNIMSLKTPINFLFFPLNLDSLLLVRMKDIVDQKYERMYYPKADQRVFGFFVSEKKLDDDYRKTIDKLSKSGV